MEISDLSRRVRNCREAHGFSSPSTMRDSEAVLSKLMLIVTEVAEAAEAVRIADEQNFGTELADVIIRILDLASSMGIDIEKVVLAKLEANERREYMHGKLI